MEILFRILMGVEAIICVLLIGIVLIQRSKGQGVGLSFGGGAEAIFGAHMGNVLTRATVVLGILFVVNTTVLAVIRPTRSTRSIAERFSAPPPAPAPATAPAAPISGDAIALPESIDISADADTSAAMPVAEEVKAEVAEAVEAVEAKAEEVKTEAAAAVKDAKEEAAEAVDAAEAKVEEVKAEAAETVEAVEAKTEEVKTEAAAAVKDAKEEAAEAVDAAEAKVEAVKAEAAEAVEAAK